MPRPYCQSRKELFLGLRTGGLQKLVNEDWTVQDVRERPASQKNETGVLRRHRASIHQIAVWSNELRAVTQRKDSQQPLIHARLVFIRVHSLAAHDARC